MDLAPLPPDPQAYSITEDALTVLQELRDNDSPPSDATIDSRYLRFQTVAIAIQTADTIDLKRLTHGI